jgi:hypothetical protein
MDQGGYFRTDIIGNIHACRQFGDTIMKCRERRRP